MNTYWGVEVYFQSEAALRGSLGPSFVPLKVHIHEFLQNAASLNFSNFI